MTPHPPAAIAQTAMTALAYGEPAANMRFGVEIAGLPGSGAFEVLFPTARIVTTRHAKCQVEYGVLTLRRGVTASSAWYEWWNANRTSQHRIRRNITVSLLGAPGVATHRWRYLDARPIAYSVSRLHALGNEVVLETLELTVQGFSAEFMPSADDVAPC